MPEKSSSGQYAWAWMLTIARSRCASVTTASGGIGGWDGRAGPQPPETKIVPTISVLAASRCRLPIEYHLIVQATARCPASSALAWKARTDGDDRFTAEY